MSAHTSIEYGPWHDPPRIGPQGFTWLAFLALFFFVPYALLIAELGSTFTDEGGCYVWTKLAFGRFQGAPPDRPPLHPAKRHRLPAAAVSANAISPRKRRK